MPSHQTLTYHAIGELARRYDARTRDLTHFELKVFSQNGEDGVIAEIVKRIGILAGYFVEFGVETGIEGNCTFLADIMRWHGLFMESDGAKHHALAQKYRHNPRIRTLHARVAPSNIDELLRDGGVPIEPDIVSIDVDGNDYWIWEAIESFRPRLVVIEYNAALDPAARLVQPYDEGIGWDGTDFFGASLGALSHLADRKGYQLVHTELAGVNAFFVRRDLAGPFGPPESVPRRVPNYFLNGGHHPADPNCRRYIDVGG